MLQHIEKAASILERLYLMNEEDNGPEALVDLEHGAAAVTDSDGKLIAANAIWKTAHTEAAENALDLAHTEEDRNQILTALRGLHSLTEQHTDFVRIVGANDDYVHLSVSRLNNSLQDDDRARYLFRSGKTIWSDTISDLIVSEFQLTRAEINLLKRMVLGDRFSQIAEDTNKGAETLKTQSKSLYRKMQVTGREDAVRLAFQLHLLLQSGSFLKKAAPDSQSTGVVRRRDGRKIVWTQKGKPNGNPVLFLHGMSLGHGFTEAFERQLTARNCRLICIDRPGYGHSDPPSNWRANLDEWVDVFPDILDQLDLQSVPVLTHTSGVMFGCAAATRYPDRVRQVCALAGGVPITDTNMLGDYPMQVRLLSRASRVSASLLRFVLSSSAAFYRREDGRQKLMKRTYGNVPVDAKALENEEINDLIHQGMTMVNLKGYDGFVGDGLRVFGDWSDQVADMQVPLHYIIGDQDPICPLDWARAFAQKYRHVDVTSVAGAGQLLHHTHSRDVIGILSENGMFDA